MYYYDNVVELQDDALYPHKMTYLFCLTFRKNIAGITTGVYGCGLSIAVSDERQQLEHGAPSQERGL